MAKLYLKYQAKNKMATAIKDYVNECVVSKLSSIDMSNALATSQLIGKQQFIAIDGKVINPQDTSKFATDNSISNNNELAFAIYQGEQPKHIILTTALSGHAVSMPITMASANKDNYLFINSIEIEMLGDGDA